MYKRLRQIWVVPCLLGLLGGGFACSKRDSSPEPEANSPATPQPQQPLPQIPVLPPFLLDETKSKEEVYEQLANAEPIKVNTANVHQWCGLVNIGQTCFMNSALKLLARQTELLNMLKDQNEKGLHPDYEDDLLKNVAHLRRAFKVVMSMIRLGKESPAQKIEGFTEYALRAFHEAMKKIDSLEHLTHCTQEDANDLLVLLTEVLSLDRDTKNTVTGLLAAGTLPGPLTHVRFEDSVPGSFSLVAKDPMAETTKSLSDVLAEFTAPELITGNNQVIIPGTSKKADHVKQIYFTGLDTSLIFLVKAYTYGTGGAVVRKTIINGPEKLTVKYLDPLPTDLSKITKQSEMPVPNKQKEMSMAAVVVHSGSVTGGHYWAFVKGDQGWSRHDDNSVTLYKGPGEDLGNIELRTTGESVNPQVYMYLYEQK